MDIKLKYTIQGITLSVGEDEQDEIRLERDPDANQHNPKGFYVYCHFDSQGVPFYIGKGTGRRAWNQKRHSLWHRYVEEKLNGEYSVIILHDELNEEEAEAIEAEWIAQDGSTLVNWVNSERQFDYDALDRFHSLRDKNRKLCAQAKSLEKVDCKRAIEIYYEALAKLDDYAFIEYETGLVADLMREEESMRGASGDHHIIDRLTLCLVREDRAEEAGQLVDSYYTKFRGDLNLRSAESIQKRVTKALAKPQKGSLSIDR